MIKPASVWLELFREWPGESKKAPLTLRLSPKPGLWSVDEQTLARLLVDPISQLAASHPEVLCSMRQISPGFTYGGLKQLLFMVRQVKGILLKELVVEMIIHIADSVERLHLALLVHSLAHVAAAIVQVVQPPFGSAQARLTVPVLAQATVAVQVLHGAGARFLRQNAVATTIVEDDLRGIVPQHLDSHARTGTPCVHSFSSCPRSDQS